MLGVAQAESTTYADGIIQLPVPMRVPPTSMTNTATVNIFNAAGVSLNITSFTIQTSFPSSVWVAISVASGLVAGNMGMLTLGVGGQLNFSGAEL